MINTSNLSVEPDQAHSVPIGIGLPLADRLTAERLAENHAGPAGVPAGGR